MANLDDEKKEKKKPVDFKKPALERPKSWSPDGLGELGVASSVPEGGGADAAAEEERLYKEYGENIFLSDQISLHRMLRDSRHES